MLKRALTFIVLFLLSSLQGFLPALGSHVAAGNLYVEFALRILIVLSLFAATVSTAAYASWQFGFYQLASDSGNIRQHVIRKASAGNLLLMATASLVTCITCQIFFGNFLGGMLLVAISLICGYLDYKYFLRGDVRSKVHDIVSK